MFGVLHSDINSPKSSLLHLTGQPYCKKSRSAKVNDGIINLFLRNYLVDRYRSFSTGNSFQPSLIFVSMAGALSGAPL
jgi:hypothetical protein